MPVSRYARLAAAASLTMLGGASLTMFGAASLTMAAAASAAPMFVPVYPVNFPDPFVIEAEREFIAYATNDGINLPMASSRDLVSWTPVMDPANPSKRLDGMPQLAPWVKEGKTWAPEVLRVGKEYLLYYTAAHGKLDRQCLGVAVASNPRGPFRDPSAAPLVCQVALGGTIDANPFRDSDGKLYIYYKNDGNRVGKRTALYGQRLSDNGRQVVGPAVALLDDKARWKDRVIEAPTMVRAPGAGHQMFYSAGYFGWNPEDRLSPYSMGYATCASALGPCTDAPGNPILNSFNDREIGCLSGPGHQSIFQVRNRYFISFHAWSATAACRKRADQRNLYIAPMAWKDGKPQFGASLRPVAK